MAGVSLRSLLPGSCRCAGFARPGRSGVRATLSGVLYRLAPDHLRGGQGRRLSVRHLRAERDKVASFSPRLRSPHRRYRVLWFQSYRSPNTCCKLCCILSINLGSKANLMNSKPGTYALVLRCACSDTRRAILSMCRVDRLNRQPKADPFPGLQLRCFSGSLTLN